MHVLVVGIQVRAEDADEFVAITRENVQETLKEPGVIRFDLIQEADNPGRFLLFEVYRQAEDHARHRETAHYKRWNAAAKPLMTQPRTRTIYHSVFPQESGWQE